jgi:hypothetical protein
LDDLFADLPTTDPLGTPLPQAPLGGAPMAASPFGSPAAVNPYAASARGKSGPSHRGKPKRTGLPWDLSDRVDSPFMGTVKAVLFSPRNAFYKMRRTGGVGGPLQFSIMGALLGAVATMVYWVVFIAVMIGIVVATQDGQVRGEAVTQLAIQVGLQFGGSIIGALIGAIIWTFIIAAFVHLFLLMLSGANQPFETTYRVVAYTYGSCSVCQIVPILGGLIAFVAWFAVLINGLYAAHETSGVKATFAVLLPLLICCAVIGVPAFLFITAAISAAAAAAG